MQKLSLFLYLLAFSLPAVAGDRLQGKWRSSLPLTSAFYNSHAIMKPSQKEFVEQIFGELVIEYRDGVAISTSPDKKVTINGKRVDWKGSAESMPYDVLFSDKDRMVIKLKQKSGESGVNVLNFVNDDTYWVYVGHSQFGSDLNIREYFVRVK